jgi:hypothetical protein
MPAHTRRSAIGILLIVFVAACRTPATETAPAPVPASGSMATPPESSQVVAKYDQIIKQVEAGDEAFLNMSLAAAG